MKNSGCVFYVVALLLTMTGCSKAMTGYVVNKSEGTVIWRTWDTGFGTREKEINGADAKTFIEFELEEVKYFGKDKNRVYWRGVEIKDADPESFSRLAGTIYYIDSKSVFFKHDAVFYKLPMVNPKSFIDLKGNWSKDDQSVFYFEERLVPDDIRSFEIIKTSSYAKDSQSVYWKGRKIENVDLGSFQVLNDEFMLFARDKNKLFWMGWAVDDVDIESVVITNSSFLCSDKNAKYRFEQVLQGSGSFDPMKVIRRPHVSP